MQSSKKSIYLISISAPRSVVSKILQIRTLLRQYGLPDSPLPPGIPVLQLWDKPKPPVSGLLPVCNTPLVVERKLEVKDWVVWPVHSSEWLRHLAEKLACNVHESDLHGHPDQLFHSRNGIPLAKVEDGIQKSGIITSEINAILEAHTGWKSLNLVCWHIEYLAGRPWYTSAVWFLLWQRHLKAIGPVNKIVPCV